MDGNGVRGRFESRSDRGSRRRSSPVTTVVESRNNLLMRLDGRIGK